MARAALDLGRELADCPGRYHGTLSAYKRGCRCPRAVKQKDVYEREYIRARRDGAPPRRVDLDPVAVEAAIEGHIPAARLMPAERRAVVTYLATVRHMTDQEIALHLRWGSDPRKARDAVLRHRRWHGIPAGVPVGHNKRTRDARNSCGSVFARRWAA